MIGESKKYLAASRAKISSINIYIYILFIAAKILLVMTDSKITWNTVVLVFFAFPTE